MAEGARCWCNRLAAYGTEVCQYHGARRLEVQLASDRRRWAEAVERWERWLAELEVRWVRAGGAPGALWALVLEGRVAEVHEALERWEVGLPAGGGQSGEPGEA